MKILQLLLTFRGRITRFSFLIITLSATVTFSLLYVFLSTITGKSSTLILYPFFFWVLLTTAVKRLHDRSKSAFWLLLLIIPLLGPLWLTIELVLIKGKAHENKYGSSPIKTEAEYLTVK